MARIPHHDLGIIETYCLLLSLDETLRDVTLSTVHGPLDYRHIIVDHAREQLERITACREPVPAEYRQQAERLARMYTIN